MSYPMPDADKHLLCPYCGDVQPAAPRCRVCGGLFEALSRDATQTTMGPWFVRDPQQPFLPGCSYEVIVRRAQTGRITPDVIVRGPTTRQWWTFARHTPGLAHLLGLCHRCGQKVDPLGAICGSCGTSFVRPTERNELGLQYPTPQAAADAARQIREKRQRLEPHAPPDEAHREPATRDEASASSEPPEHAPAPGAEAGTALGRGPVSAWHRPESPPTVGTHGFARAGSTMGTADEPTDGGPMLRQMVAALSPPMGIGTGDGPARGPGIQPIGGGMRVQAPGASVARGLGWSLAIAAAVLLAGILLLVATHR